MASNRSDAERTGKTRPEEVGQDPAGDASGIEADSLTRLQTRAQPQQFEPPEAVPVPAACKLFVNGYVETDAWSVSVALSFPGPRHT